MGYATKRLVLSRRCHELHCCDCIIYTLDNAQFLKRYQTDTLQFLVPHQALLTTVIISANRGQLRQFALLGSFSILGNVDSPAGCCTDKFPTVGFQAHPKKYHQLLQSDGRQISNCRAKFRNPGCDVLQQSLPIA